MYNFNKLQFFYCLTSAENTDDEKTFLVLLSVFMAKADIQY